MLEVEREMQDMAERNRQMALMQSRGGQGFNLTKSSMLESVNEDGFKQMTDQDVIGQEDQETGTEDFDQYLIRSGQRRLKDRENQTDPRWATCEVGSIVTPEHLEMLAEAETDTHDLNEGSRR
jgi:hypothetical protein